MSTFEVAVLTLLRFVVLSAGITYYVTQSTVLSVFRELLTRRQRRSVIALFIYCPACVGTWVGAALALLGYWSLSHGWLGVFEAAVAACIVNRMMPYTLPPDYDDYEQLASEIADETEER